MGKCCRRQSWFLAVVLIASSSSYGIAASIVVGTAPGTGKLITFLGTNPFDESYKNCTLTVTYSSKDVDNQSFTQYFSIEKNAKNVPIGTFDLGPHKNGFIVNYFASC